LRETRIQKEILDYCYNSGIWVWRSANGGRIRGGKIIGKSPLKGLPDICGVHRDGRAIFIEVKTKTGELSAEQTYFIERATQRKAIVIVARSLEEFLLKWESQAKMSDLKDLKIAKLQKQLEDLRQLKKKAPRLTVGPNAVQGEKRRGRPSLAYTKNIMIRVDDHTYQLVKNESERIGEPIAEIIRFLIQDNLKPKRKKTISEQSSETAIPS
jgi:hypothetical protein